MFELAPSILSADFTKLADEIRAIEAGGATVLHFDVMDGQVCSEHHGRVAGFEIGQEIYKDDD